MSKMKIAGEAGGIRRVEPAELDAVVHAHELFAGHKHGGARLKLHFCELSGTDFANRVLNEADFSGSVLYGANMRFAELKHADLYCTDMRAVDARYANLSYADMRGATLNGSNLSHAVLDRADFRPGRLARAGMWEPDSAMQREGSAIGVDFSFCSLHGTSFEGANLKGARFDGAIIRAAKFTGTHLEGATFNGAVLTEVDVAELRVPAAALANCTLPPKPSAIAEAPHLLAKLQGHERWVTSDGRGGTSATLDDKDLRPLAATVGRFKLTALSAKRAIAVGVDFSGTELQGADFDGADLRGVNFAGADLRGAMFRGALLHHAKFTAADLRPLALRHGGVQACDFTNSSVTADQLADAMTMAD